MADVYVFGDSHWRVFFPFVNHGAATDHVSHEERGVRTIDTIANELSGATMWGLLNPNSKNGARNRILNTLTELGGTDNVGLVFGEVDARFHHDRYYDATGRISNARILRLLANYAQFIHEDLLATRLVRKNVFVYHGFSYPQMQDTLLQPGQPIGDKLFRAMEVNEHVNCLLDTALAHPKVHVISLPCQETARMVSADGVHLEPAVIYSYILPVMERVLNKSVREIPF